MLVASTKAVLMLDWSEVVDATTEKLVLVVDRSELISAAVADEVGMVVLDDI